MMVVATTGTSRAEPQVKIIKHRKAATPCLTDTPGLISSLPAAVTPTLPRCIGPPVSDLTSRLVKSA